MDSLNHPTKPLDCSKIIYMKKYYVNKNAQSNGDHEVHSEDCLFLPGEVNRIYLGLHLGCDSAVREGSKHFNSVDGCKFCSPSCHNR
jgi:hypothetical protein